ncbi:22146_t:CDS:2, partial [Gigaspora rosea]
IVSIILIGWEGIKKLTPAGRIQCPAYMCCGVSTAQDGEDILFNYNWVADPECQNEGGNHIYFNDSSKNNNAIDLTQSNNNDDYSSLDENSKNRSEYGSDSKNNDSKDENVHKNEIIIFEKRMKIIGMKIK